MRYPIDADNCVCGWLPVLLMATEDQSVKPDNPDGGPDSMDVLKENTLILWPVPDNASGEGLPYAPVDWPNAGDVWRWKVGKRRTSNGFMLDRYLYPPRRFRNLGAKKPFYASLLSFKEFVRNEYPDCDTEALFASFSWKVPAEAHFGQTVGYADWHCKEVMAECSGLDNYIDRKCKARNKMCGLQLEASSSSAPVMDCDICCSESGFCRDCCCILCSRSIDWAFGGYSFIRCEANVRENQICGHAAHIDCALRSYMAGTVGGSIGLDVEYYCRRCDNRTNLISHASKILKTCESLDSQDDVEKILKMGLCIVRGSQQEYAKVLHNRMGLALAKLISGIHVKDIWVMEDNNKAVSSGPVRNLGNNGTFGMEDTQGIYPQGSDNIQKKYHQPVYITSAHQIESSKLNEEIEQVLGDLRRSQEFEYRMAEQRLNCQKHLLVTLYQQLDADRSKLAKRTASTRESDVDALLTNIFSRVNQIKQEVSRFKDMEELAKGFGRASSDILKEHFGFHIDD